MLGEPFLGGIGSIGERGSLGLSGLRGTAEELSGLAAVPLLAVSDECLARLFFFFLVFFAWSGWEGVLVDCAATGKATRPASTNV